MPPAAATSVPKRAIAIRWRASRPPVGAASGGRLDVAVTEDFRLPARREEASGEPGATPGVEGVSPVAAWPGMPLWTRPLPLRACRAGLRARVGRDPDAGR